MHWFTEDKLQCVSVISQSGALFCYTFREVSIDRDQFIACACLGKIDIMEFDVSLSFAQLISLLNMT